MAHSFRLFARPEDRDHIASTPIRLAIGVRRGPVVILLVAIVRDDTVLVDGPARVQ
jgi:hypothetical protein